jgi:hypothetical protein
MPLMREFGGLERKRMGDGVTPSNSSAGST